MATGLNCLIKDRQIINRIKNSFNNIANSLISANGNAKVTAKDLYNRMKSVGIDIDLESVASIYSEAFASSIDVYSNFETSEELQAYKRKSVPISNEAKQALISLGYGKKLKDGKTILDWTKLMRKSEDEIKAEIEKYITEAYPENTPKNIIQENIDSVYESLKGEWKQIISNAIIKQQSKLRQRDAEKSPMVKDAINKLADLYGEGLFDEFKDDYKNAMRKAVGVSTDNLVAMSELDELAKTANFMASSSYGQKNHIGNILQEQANRIIAQARYKEANWIYRRAKNISNIFDFVLLKILNNPFNRLENYLSGAAGSLFTSVTYGMPDKKIKELRKQTKRDIIRNGGVDFGEVNNMLLGDKKSIDNVRDKISKFITGDETSTVTNWTYNQIMGIASLNGVDSYRKVSNTWARFISGLEDVLVSKGMTKEDARNNLHNELFGKGKWEEAEKKASDFIDDANANGGFQIKKNKQTIKRFAADIVKAELVESKLITQEELQGAWNAGYKAAGQEMGHVANNIFTRGVNAMKVENGKMIDDAVKDKKYSKAATLVLVDTILNKSILKFAGGGSNWVVLKLEKGGLGLVRGGIERGVYNSSFKDRKNLSSMTADEIEQSLYEVQRTRDRITRGSVGAISNVAFMFIALAALKSGGKDEEERKRRRLLKWFENNYQAQKALTKVAPLWIAAYFAKMKQDDDSWSDLSSKYKKQPIVQFGQNLFNVNPDYSLFKQGLDFFNSYQEILSEKDWKIQKNAKGEIIKHNDTYEEYKSKGLDKQKKSAEGMGKMMGNYFDFNPLPTQLAKGIYDIYKDISGDDKYVPPKYDSKLDARKSGYFGSGILGIWKPFQKKSDKK